jgi:cell division septation protein DedD
MAHHVTVIALFAVATGLAACGGIVGIPPSPASWPTPPPEVVREQIRYPEVRLNVPSAIAADAEAQRFLLLRQLVEAGLVTPQEADARRNANLGALLPYSAPPPAAGLGRPAALRELADRLSRLSVPVAGLPASVQKAERDFLMDTLLPAEPAARTPPARKDSAALAIGRRRAEDLGRLGLVEYGEYQREMATIIAAERELANAPPPPPPPPKKKPTRKKPTIPDGGVSGATKPADVPGGTISFNPKGILGLHLLSMASPTTTDKAVETLKKEYPELAPLEFKAVKTDIPELGTTYRLMAGPLPGADAESLCRALRGKGQSCAITNY